MGEPESEPTEADLAKFDQLLNQVPDPNALREAARVQNRAFAEVLSELKPALDVRRQKEGT